MAGNIPTISPAQLQYLLGRTEREDTELNPPTSLTEMWERTPEPDRHLMLIRLKQLVGPELAYEERRGR